jgi:hypothetical protein
VHVPWNLPPIVEFHEHVGQSSVIENPSPERPFNVILSIELRHDDERRGAACGGEGRSCAKHFGRHANAALDRRLAAIRHDQRRK